MLFTSQAYTKNVLISFDGSNSLTMWQDSLDFAKTNNVKFTYYVSAPYFVDKDEVIAKNYWAIEKYGNPIVEFRKPEKAWAINKRFGYLDRAIVEGHEISSHLVGHYNGQKWTAEEWKKELIFFDNVFYNYNIVGIRAPELGVNQSYFEAVGRTARIKYDSSLVLGKDTDKYNQGNIKEIPIHQIRVIYYPTLFDEKDEYRTLPFDYNFDILFDSRKDKLSDKQIEDIFFTSLIWDYRYGTEPMMICLHFEQMKHGAYYKAMKRFVEWAAKQDSKPKYLTYKEYADNL